MKHGTYANLETGQITQYLCNPHFIVPVVVTLAISTPSTDRRI